MLFGTDGPWPEARLHINWRFFETRDESFAYSEKSPPPQGMWQIHGVGLPRDVLRKLYFENASRLIPGVAERLSKYRGSEEDADTSRLEGTDGNGGKRSDSSAREQREP